MRIRTACLRATRAANDACSSERSEALFVFSRAFAIKSGFEWVLGRPLGLVEHAERSGPGLLRQLERRDFVRHIVAASSSGVPSFFFSSIILNAPPFRGFAASNAPS